MDEIGVKLYIFFVDVMNSKRQVRETFLVTWYKLMLVVSVSGQSKSDSKNS